MTKTIQHTKERTFEELAIPLIITLQDSVAVAEQLGYSQRVVKSRLANLGYSKLWRVSKGASPDSEIEKLLLDTQNASEVARHLEKDYKNTWHMLTDQGLVSSWRYVSDEEIERAMALFDGDLYKVAKLLKVTITHIRGRVS